MSVGISVIICCYNSANRLQNTLGYLAAQHIPNDINWELVIVDNISTDDTFSVAKREIKRYKIFINKTMIVTEYEPGLSYARKKGISVSKYDYIVLCDDDNWLQKDYLKNVYQIFNENKNIGIIGGMGIPVFENEKPFWFDRFYEGYAVHKGDEKTANVNSVCGAGMAIRKVIFKKCTQLNIRSLLSDRKGKELTSGGDSEICYWARMMNYQVQFNCQLKFKHYISYERLNWQYLKKLHKGFAASYPILNIYELIMNGSVFSQCYLIRKAIYFELLRMKYYFPFYKSLNTDVGEESSILFISWRAQSLSYLKMGFSNPKIINRIRVYKELLNGD